MEFPIALTIALTVIYFIMGLGVFNMWKRIIDDDWSIFIILMWPFVLIIPAIFDKN
jgi:hypothetical protein